MSDAIEVQVTVTCLVCNAEAEGVDKAQAIEAAKEAVAEAVNHAMHRGFNQPHENLCVNIEDVEAVAPA